MLRISYHCEIMFTKKVEAPYKRSRLRKKLGKRYFIIKRRLSWLKNTKTFATQLTKEDLPQKWKEHSSTLLRPLKNVDMQLQYNKITNLRLAGEKINGLILSPGKKFSFWKLVGSPTKNKGYLPGLVLENGGIGSDYGGGLCQMGNLIYWMTLHTPLTITERYRHGYDVFPDINRTLPFGSGATLSYNYIDLQIENTTDSDFQLKIWLSDEKLHGSWLSNKQPDKEYVVYESEHEIHTQQWGGYTRHNQIRRKTIDLNGREIDDELITENHAIMMYNPLLESSEKI